MLLLKHKLISRRSKIKKVIYEALEWLGNNPLPWDPIKMAFPLTPRNPWQIKYGPFGSSSPPSAPSPPPVYHQPDQLASAVQPKPKPKPKPKARLQPAPPPSKALNKPGSKPAPRLKHAGKCPRKATPDPPPQRAHRATQPTISFAPPPRPQTPQPNAPPQKRYKQARLRASFPRPTRFRPLSPPTTQPTTLA